MHNHPVRENFCKEDCIKILAKGQIELEGQFILGSNYTFLVNLTYKDNNIRAVYKPNKGEVPLWDFPRESLSGREVAAYLISEALNWNFVPPTVIRDNGPFGSGSIQLYISHDPEVNYFSFEAQIHTRLKKVAVFDMLINNADRKGSHILLDENQHIWLIDHGLCFHSTPKLRTIIWDFAGQAIDNHFLQDLENLLEILRYESETSNELGGLLTTDEIDALRSRILFIIKHPVFPSPDKDKRQFPWPLV